MERVMDGSINLPISYEKPKNEKISNQLNGTKTNVNADSREEEA